MLTKALCIPISAVPSWRPPNLKTLMGQPYVDNRSSTFVHTAEAQADAEEDGSRDADDVTFTDVDIGGAAPPLPRQAPPLPADLPPMLPLSGAGPRPMPFPGAFFGHPPMHMSAALAARNHDQLVQAFKDLLLEVKVACTHINLPPRLPTPPASASMLASVDSAWAALFQLPIWKSAMLVACTFCVGSCSCYARLAPAHWGHARA